MKQLLKVVNLTGARIESFFLASTDRHELQRAVSKQSAGITKSDEKFKGRRQGGVRATVPSVGQTSALRALRDRLREWRERARLTLREVSLRTEQSENYYGMIERGNRNPSEPMLEKICAVLNLPAAEREEAFRLYAVGMLRETVSRKTRRLTPGTQALIRDELASAPQDDHAVAPPPGPEPGAAARALLELAPKLRKSGRRGRPTDVSARVKEYLYGRRS